MSKYTVVDKRNSNTRVFDDEAEAKDKRNSLKSIVDNPSDIDMVEGAYEDYTAFENRDETPPETEEVDPEIVDMTEPEPETPADPGTPAAKAAQPDPQEPDQSDELVLRENPIEYLRGVNPEFVNTIKGTPAISKRGFRFIQVHLGIKTTSEVVESFENPRGVIVHARAELPNGRYAEAHGEGYAKGDVDSHEFARYADTRAKNRAISDLTSSGALAESELQ